MGCGTANLTFQPPKVFFFANLVPGWAWQYPSSSNGKAAYRLVFVPPFLLELLFALLALLLELVLFLDVLLEKLAASFISS